MDPEDVKKEKTLSFFYGPARQCDETQLPQVRGSEGEERLWGVSPGAPPATTTRARRGESPSS